MAKTETEKIIEKVERYGRVVAIYEENEKGEWDFKDAQAWCEDEGAQVHHEGRYHIAFIPFRVLEMKRS